MAGVEPCADAPGPGTRGDRAGSPRVRGLTAPATANASGRRVTNDARHRVPGRAPPRATTCGWELAGRMDRARAGEARQGADGHRAVAGRLCRGPRTDRCAADV